MRSASGGATGSNSSGNMRHTRRHCVRHASRVADCSSTFAYAQSVSYRSAGFGGDESSWISTARASCSAAGSISPNAA